MLVALVIVGLTSNSIGVLAAGGDYLADSAAIALALVAVRIGRRAAGREPGASPSRPRMPLWSALHHLGDEAVMRAITLDTVADAAAAGGVALAGAVILVSGRFYWLDPALAAIISTVVGFRAAFLLRDVIRSLQVQPAA
jgi:Co/Zn/Cd efflux system component